MKLQITGIIPAGFTPMQENGELNLDLIDQYADYLTKGKVENIFVLGTAGEGCSLSNEERQKVAEKWMQAAKNKIKNVIVHVGTCNLANTKILARHAESIGVTAIAAISSLYYKPSDPKYLAMYLAEIAKEAPNTPMMYYHIPVTTGVNISVHLLLDEIHKLVIPNFAGIKFTSHDLCDFGRCVEKHGDKYTMCYGYDEQVIAGLVLGAEGCVGSTYNYALNIYHRLFNACKREDIKEARSLQYKSQKYISCMIQQGIDIGTQKAVMSAVTGMDFGPPRLPVSPPSKEKIGRIMDEFEKMGFFEWIK